MGDSKFFGSGDPGQPFGPGLDAVLVERNADISGEEVRVGVMEISFSFWTEKDGHQVIQSGFTFGIHPFLEEEICKMEFPCTDVGQPITRAMVDPTPPSEFRKGINGSLIFLEQKVGVLAELLDLIRIQTQKGTTLLGEPHQVIRPNPKKDGKELDPQGLQDLIKGGERGGTKVCRPEGTPTHEPDTFKIFGNMDELSLGELIPTRRNLNRGFPFVAWKVNAFHTSKMGEGRRRLKDRSSI